MRYVEHKIATGGKGHSVNIIYERALKELPGRLVITIYENYALVVIGLFIYII